MAPNMATIDGYLTLEKFTFSGFTARRWTVSGVQYDVGRFHYLGQEILWDTPSAMHNNGVWPVTTGTVAASTDSGKLLTEDDLRLRSYQAPYYDWGVVNSVQNWPDYDVSIIGN